MTGAKSCGFIDSNVVLYLLSQDVVKADSAEALLKANPVIASCRALYSEDMNHGQMLEDSLVIQNPFSYTQ
ncbi:hypothetical protein [Photorhabdus heterorhabditis]|uniref:hypothetical protein n=1 Tax=Photorhabdus heterorhabditis TaxID=880156 RepID=UPI001561F219|nr:hypothetical protein [Photorhabdus heterorhabditis]NRN29585.1 PIN domain-containing protein [Photorhabdus heterorhabditis subsp. aluminescens]